ncbi:MAG TPA: hypothetical protein VEX35_10015 [Allosphingosinicella sp.]|nr:hypothetical protein [Allosphingosinicella sp.]
MPAQAIAQDGEPCVGFQRIIAASREATPFASIGQALARGESVAPGFPASSCRVLGKARGLTCHLSASPVRSFDGWPDPLACSGLTAAPGPAAGRRLLGDDWARAYRGGGLRFAYGVRCTICAGHAFGGFTVTLDRPEDEAR